MGDRNSQIQWELEKCDRPSKLEIRPAATAASRITEFYRFNQCGESWWSLTGGWYVPPDLTNPCRLCEGILVSQGWRANLLAFQAS